VLFVAEDRDPLMAPPERIWRRTASRLETIMVGGNHRSMLAAEDGVHLAHILSDRLAKALGHFQRNRE